MLRREPDGSNLSRAVNRHPFLGPSATNTLREYCVFEPIAQPFRHEPIVKDGIAVGTARTFFGPYSETFVHGPDTLVPITDLSERLLKPGERLSTLSMRWIARTRGGLIVVAARETETPDTGVRPNIRGKFTTDTGGTIYVVAYPDEDSQITTGPAEPISDEIMDGVKSGGAPIKDNDGSVTFTVPPLPDDILALLGDSLPLVANTGVETMVQLVQAIARNGHIPPFLSLLASVDNFDLTAFEGVVSRGGKIALKPSVPSTYTSSGFILLPIEFTITPEGSTAPARKGVYTRAFKIF